MKLANSVLLKVLGILLLTGAILKGWQLLTEPVANSDIWSNRLFLILTVEFELALAIWLLSGLFKKASWLASLLCFSLFSMITFYKGVTGASSCGCFGSVHVNPWITLFAIDLPSVVALSIFRPGKILPPHILARIKLHRRPIKALIRQFVKPLPSAPRFAVTACFGLCILGVTIPILALNKPAVVTSKYEVLEPETWVGRELPILEYINIAETLRKGTWLVLFYHYDCPDCGWAIPMYEQMARDLEGNEDFMQIALVAVPPYGRGPVSANCPCALGKLNQSKEWFVTTPATALLTDGQVKSAWEEKAPDFETIIQKMTKFQENQKNRDFSVWFNPGWLPQARFGDGKAPKSSATIPKSSGFEATTHNKVSNQCYAKSDLFELYQFFASTNDPKHSLSRGKGVRAMRMTNARRYMTT
jgi:thiol-disulfide isomerase/thioredoxin